MVTPYLLPEEAGSFFGGFKTVALHLISAACQRAAAGAAAGVNTYRLGNMWAFHWFAHDLIRRTSVQRNTLFCPFCRGKSWILCRSPSLCHSFVNPCLPSMLLSFMLLTLGRWDEANLRKAHCLIHRPSCSLLIKSLHIIFCLCGVLIFPSRLCELCQSGNLSGVVTNCGLFPNPLQTSAAFYLICVHDGSKEKWLTIFVIVE